MLFKLVSMLYCHIWIVFGVSQFIQCLLSLPHHILCNIAESFWTHLIHWAKPMWIYRVILPRWHFKPCLRRASKRRARAPIEVWLSRLPCKRDGVWSWEVLRQSIQQAARPSGTSQFTRIDFDGRSMKAGRQILNRRRTQILQKNTYENWEYKRYNTKPVRMPMIRQGLVNPKLEMCYSCLHFSIFQARFVLLWPNSL